MCVIEFCAFSAFYRHKRSYDVALDKINLQVDEGEFVAIAGPSGCGKTTLLRSIMGFIKTTTGTLRVCGEDSETMELSRQSIGYVSQEYNLYPSMTVYENIAYPLKIMGADAAEIDRRVREMAERFGISFLLTRKPRQLSGGQQQRLALARALVKNPRILLLDEPFSNVADDIKPELYALLRKYHTEQKPTILLVTHDLQEAAALSSRVVFLDEGQIKESAAPETVLSAVQKESAGI